MSTEKKSRAGGGAQSKDVDETPRLNGADDPETEDADEKRDSQRAGGGAQSKDV